MVRAVSRNNDKMEGAIGTVANENALYRSFSFVSKKGALGEMVPYKIPFVKPV